MIEREHRAIFTAQLRRRGRGRPPVVPGERAEPLTVHLPRKLFDRLTSEAFRRQRGLSEHVRSVLTDYSNEK